MNSADLEELRRAHFPIYPRRLILSPTSLYLSQRQVPPHQYYTTVSLADAANAIPCASHLGYNQYAHRLALFNARMPFVIPHRHCWPLNSVQFAPGIELHAMQSENAANASSGVNEKRKLENNSEIKINKKVKTETKALKSKRPGFTEERYDETSYYVENGLRKVHPYYFTFTTFCKGRWVGQPILEVFAKEFRAHSADQYEKCMKAGKLTVNYKAVDINYKLQHNDLLAHTVHRHEVPVANIPIHIIHMSDDLVVVNKPPSIPVHPCGRYRHNTVVFVLAKEFNLKNLRTIHRLDRLTSGLLLFGRTLEKSRQLENEIRTRLVLKEYVCRVEGEFPEEPIVCEEPIEVVSYKIGVCRVGANGKQCRTVFSKIAYNNNTSVVLCKPHTGRMHQIRVHLQYLGFPIVNDPLYNHPVFGVEKGKNGNIGKSNEELVSDLIKLHNAESWLLEDTEKSLGSSVPVDLEKSEDENKAEVPSKFTKDPDCYECHLNYRDPKPNDLVMFLHAWKYKGTDWSFETELPEWANEDWDDTNQICTAQSNLSLSSQA